MGKVHDCLLAYGFDTHPSPCQLVSNADLSFLLFFLYLPFLTAVSSRKAPPPVPPRGTSKPLISVTAQSSTESAQDTYLDQQDRGSEANSQSGRSNSSDSLCSIRTGGLAQGSKPSPAPFPEIAPPPAAASIPPVPAPRELPPTITVTTATTSTRPQNDTVSICVTLDQPPTAPRRKLSSIGVQVVCQSFCNHASQGGMVLHSLSFLPCYI